MVLQRKTLNLLTELKAGLEALYDGQLCDIYLYGSYARGEQDLESDLDILIILVDFDSYRTEIERTGELVSGLSLKYGISISRKFINEKDWQNKSSSLLRNVRTEAIAV
jgi:uncharacterized protein